jgi:hypothetical protein
MPPAEESRKFDVLVDREAAIPQNAAFFTPKGAGAGRQILENRQTPSGLGLALQKNI